MSTFELFQIYSTFLKHGNTMMVSLSKGKHHLGGSLVLTLNTSLRDAALTHNGLAGNCRRDEDGARATQEGGGAGLNGGRGVARLHHRVDNVGGGAAAVGGDRCLQSWQLMRMQFEIAGVWGGELTDHLALAGRQTLMVCFSALKAMYSQISSIQILWGTCSST